LLNTANVFQPHPSENQPQEEEALMQLLETPYQLEPPINRLKRAEVQEVINRLNPKKLPGYDLITGKILKEFAYHWNKISYPDIQCCLAQRVLLGTMESRTDHSHLEARKTS
jgi:hypothetical protein